MEIRYEGKAESDYERQFAELSDIIENAPYFMTRGGESFVDSAALAKAGNKCQSRSRSTRSAGLSARLSVEKKL